MECLCLRPGYPSNANELQIVMNTQKSPYLNQAHFLLKKINTYQIFVTEKSRHRKFQTQKYPSIIPVT